MKQNKGKVMNRMEKLYSIHMGKAKCAVDLGDGSERGEYVNQDYIQIGRASCRERV